MQSHGEFDKKDCYFDKECHAKVDWDKVSKLKDGVLARLYSLKEKKDESAVKEMMTKVRPMLHEAGMPDDRIDHILNKWAESAYPEELDAKSARGKPRSDICAMAKMRCTKDRSKVLDGRCAIAWKECEAETKRTTLGKDAHASKEKSPEGKPRFEMCEMATKRCLKDGRKVLDGRCAEAWEQCGAEMAEAKAAQPDESQMARKEAPAHPAALQKPSAEPAIV
jgi:hypothetical protein